MKKLLVLIIIFVLFTGCGSPKEPEQPEKPDEIYLELSPDDKPNPLTSYEIEDFGGGRYGFKMFGFDNPDEIGRFVYGNVNVYAEMETIETADGEEYRASATFFRSVDTSGKKLYFYVMMHPLRGRYSDWSAGDELVFTVTNENDFDVTLYYSISDETEGNLEVRQDLTAGVRKEVSVPVEFLEKGHVDIAHIKRMTFWLIDSEIPEIATVTFDDFILKGRNKEKLEGMKLKAEAESARQFESWGAEEKAEYIPKIYHNQSSISTVTAMYQPGPIDGVAECDVVVVGGGMSGTSAAIAAARQGADVILIEAYGFLGGMATAGMVFPFMSSRAGDEQIIRGIFLEIFERLKADGKAKRDRNEPGIIWFDKEALKYVLQEMCIEAGVKLMLHTWAESALLEKDYQGTGNPPVDGVMVGNKSGRIAVLGKVTIDCTGDGDIAASAGCPYEQGRGYDIYTQSATLFFRMGNVNITKAFTELNSRLYRSENMIPAEYMFNDLFKEAKAKGDLDPDLPINVVYFEKTLSPGVVSINATRAFKVDPTKATDLTYAEVETRRQVHQMSKFLKKYIPGFENSFLQESAVHLGVRESRRILGEYQLTGKDVLSAAQFDDVIALGSFGIDIHCADFSGCGVVGLKLEKGKSYDIPYRCLVPLDVDGILMAGRCLSATHVALGSARIMPVASATGQAAGVAAALAVMNGIEPRHVDIPTLQTELVKQGAYLGG